MAQNSVSLENQDSTRKKVARQRKKREAGQSELNGCRLNDTGCTRKGTHNRNPTKPRRAKAKTQHSMPQKGATRSVNNALQAKPRDMHVTHANRHTAKVTPQPQSPKGASPSPDKRQTLLHLPRTSTNLAEHKWLNAATLAPPSPGRRRNNPSTYQSRMHIRCNKNAHPSKGKQ